MAYLPDNAATERLAEDLLEALPRAIAGWTILLSGDLGAGKSTFARAFIHAAGHKGAVPSPTYTLVEPYQTSRGDIYHIDLYRISGGDELHFLGWDELEQGCRLVEWPERAPLLVDVADLKLVLSYDGDGRRADFEALNERGETVLAVFSNLDSTD